MNMSCMQLRKRLVSEGPPLWRRRLPTEDYRVAAIAPHTTHTTHARQLRRCLQGFLFEVRTIAWLGRRT